MTMLEAARMGDKVAHSNAFLGFVTGMVVGAVLAVGLALLAGATIATGGGALILAGALLAGAGGGALGGMSIGETIKKGEGDPIATGARSVFIGRDRRRAARATLDIASCDNKLIAEGSDSVFVEGGPSARRTDKTECGGTIDEGWPTVFIGRATAGYLPVESEVPAWMVSTAKWAMILGTALGLVGGVIVAGVAITAVGFVGGLIGGEIGSAVGGWVGRQLGGLTGERIGQVIGGEIGGFFGGRVANTRLATRAQAAELNASRRLLATRPVLAARIARVHGESPTAIAARQQVARSHYERTRPFSDFRQGKTGTDADLRRQWSDDLDSHMAGIDFRQPVRVEEIPTGTTLYTYNKPGAGNAGAYFTREPARPTDLGISENVTVRRTDGSYETVPRELYTVKTTQPTEALVSTTSPKLDNWTVQRLDASGRPIVDANNQAVPVIAEARGGGEQLNINTVRNAHPDRPTQQQLFEPTKTGILEPTGQNASSYSDPRTVQDSSRQVRDNYHQAVAGDADYRPPTAIGAAQGLPAANNPITGIGTVGDDEGDP